jgi:hypothetical protein
MLYVLGTTPNYTSFDKYTCPVEKYNGIAPIHHINLMKINMLLK